MEEEIDNKSNIITTIFFICFFIMMLFGFNNELVVSSAIYKNIIIPHFNVNITIYLAMLSIVIIVMLLLFKRSKIDFITLLLILRIPLYIIPVLYITGDFKIGVLYAIVQCVFSYFIGINSGKKIESLVKLLAVYTIIIFLEEIYVLFANNISIFSKELKWFMVLPMGKSNYISCVLLPIYVFVSRFYNDRKSFNILYTIMIFLAILATGSKLALVVFAGYIVYEIIFRFFSSKKYSRKKIIIGIMEILIIFSIAIISINRYYNGIITIILKFTQNNIFENRILVYKDAIKLIFEHIFLGRSAFSYIAFDAVMAHNFLLESLVQTGIIGTILFLIILICIFNKVKNINNTKIKYTMMGFLTIYLIQGLAEPNLFGATSDAFFWIIVGIAVSCSNNSKNKLTDKKENIKNTINNTIKF